jgi:hypothetical protein
MQETAEFQERYAQTVVYRIMYMLDRSEKGYLSESDIRRSSLAAAIAQLDIEDDINKVLNFFSYEHFYVMYCKVRAVFKHCSAMALLNNGVAKYLTNTSRILGTTPPIVTHAMQRAGQWCNVSLLLLFTIIYHHS